MKSIRKQNLWVCQELTAIVRNKHTISVVAELGFVKLDDFGTFGINLNLFVEL